MPSYKRVDAGTIIDPASLFIDDMVSSGTVKKVDDVDGRVVGAVRLEVESDVAMMAYVPQEHELRGSVTEEDTA